MQADHLVDTSAKGKAGNGHKITCRTIEVDEAKLLKALGIHNPRRKAYSIFRQLSKADPELTPIDIGRAVERSG
jgi:hypothetical protein